MLILSRKQGEKIVVHLGQGRKLTIEVIRTGKSKIILGLEAPQDIRILREEIKGKQEKTPV